MSDAFEHSIPAERAASAEIGEPTTVDLAIINERIALREMAADELFAWSFEISNSHPDSHGTWMDVTSLENYGRQATTGRGIPYLRHHDVYADEVGRVFNAEMLRGEDRRPSEVGLPLARDVFRSPRSTLRLIERAFTVRSLSADHVARIESGISASNSIGFSLYSPAAPGSMLECDICKRDLFAKDEAGHYLCKHIPRMTYLVERENEDAVEVMATARVVNATQREASGVYMGSTPGTYTLANRAFEIYGDGELSEKDARLYEDVLELQRGLVTAGYPTQTTSVPARIRRAAPVDLASNMTTDTHELREAMTAAHDAMSTWTADDGGVEPRQEQDMSEYDGTSRALELMAGDGDRIAALELIGETLENDPVGAVLRVLDDEVTEVIFERDEIDSRHHEFKALVRERLHISDGEDTADGIDRVMADAEVAHEFRAELQADVVKQMTRAGLEFDADEQAPLFDAMTVSQLRDQARMYQRSADAQYKAGRVSDPELESRAPQDSADTPDPRAYV